MTEDDDRLDEDTALKVYVGTELTEIYARVEGTFEDVDHVSEHHALEQVRDRLARMLTTLGLALPEPVTGTEYGCARCGRNHFASGWTSPREIEEDQYDHARRCTGSQARPEAETSGRLAVQTSAEQ